VISSSRALRGLASDFSGEEGVAVEDGVGVDEEVGLEGGSVEEVSVVEEVGVVELLVGGWLLAGEVDDVVEFLVLEGGSVEGVDAVRGVGVVGAADDLVGWDEGSGVETGHSADARKEASCSWQLV